MRLGIVRADLSASLYYLYTSGTTLPRDWIKCSQAAQYCDGDCIKCPQVVQYCCEIVLSVHKWYNIAARLY